MSICVSISEGFDTCMMYPIDSAEDQPNLFRANPRIINYRKNSCRQPYLRIFERPYVPTKET